MNRSRFTSLRTSQRWVAPLAIAEVCLVAASMAPHSFAQSWSPRQRQRIVAIPELLAFGRVCAAGGAAARSRAALGRTASWIILAIVLLAAVMLCVFFGQGDALRR